MLSLNAPGYFVTANDTDAGKTAASCWLLAQARAQGFDVYARKPLASGCFVQTQGLVCADTQKLQHASGGKESLDTITPWRFQAAISPEEACLQAGIGLSLEQVLQACETPTKENQLTIVEGAGGFLSPLFPGHLNRDLAKALGLPIVLVIRNQLGCINQALLCVEAIRQANLPIAHLLLNPYFDTHQLAENQAAIMRYSGLPVEQLPFLQPLL
jgi:dethiobiotin synthetase